MLELLREYFPDGTNGTLLYNGVIICKTIELPWHDNAKKVSCIPEGEYSVSLRCNSKFGWHLIVNGVDKRSGILFHPANNAKLELKGCIAPVQKISAPGVGTSSKAALKLLLAAIDQELENNPVQLTIKKK